MNVPPPPPPKGGDVMPGGTGGQDGGRSRRRRRSAKQGAWMAHVKATMRAHKGKSLREALILAGKTYKKKMRGGQSEITPSFDVPGSGGAPAVGGRRRRGSTRRSRARRGGDE